MPGRKRTRRKLSSSSSSSESDSDESWSSSAGESESEEELCDYEKRRLDNIRRNQEMMKSLGKKVLWHAPVLIPSLVLLLATQFSFLDIPQGLEA